MKIISIKMLLVAVAILAGMQGVQAQSDSGIVGEWHFDGDAKDSSGNGNDGTIYGAAFVEGKFGKALSFNGVNDWVDLGDKFESYSAMTVSAFFKTSDLSYDPSKDKMVVAKWGGEGQASWFIAQNGNTVRVTFLTDGGEYGTSWATTSLSLDKWYHVVGVYDGNNVKIYLNGDLEATNSLTGTIKNSNVNTRIGAEDRGYYFNGIIDEVRIYNRALSAEEIKKQYEGKQTALTVTKTASPYSIKQRQTTTITLTIKNTGTTDITNIEIMDSIHPNFDLISGDFPNPKKYDIIRQGESREIQYIIKAKESGTFNLDPVTSIYADKDGNILEVKSEPFSVKVIPSFEGTSESTAESSSPSEIGSSSAVLLHGEKTDVVLGEDILLKLSAVNLITKPPMTVQVILYPPSGMSVTGSEFVKSGAGIYTTTYSLNPGDGKDIEIHIKSNQVGDFGVKGRIVYYFGDDKRSVEDRTLTLPIKVRKEPGQTVPSPAGSNDLGATPKAPGFAGGIAIIGVLFMAVYIRKRF